MSPVTCQLLLFARYPVAGSAKTRLIPALGPDGAALLHRRMTEHAVTAARQAAAGDDTSVTVCFTGAGRPAMRAWLGGGPMYRPQSRGDLGTRLQHAFASAFGSNANRVVAMGSDVPAIDKHALQRALALLADRDVVLGPATDGGYYLIGMREYRPQVFNGIDWGTERVLSQTRSAVARAGLKLGLLAALDDVDRPEDLDALRDDPRFTDVFSGSPLLSVIIPTWNEAATLPATLDRAADADQAEVLVVDGGSRDGTPEAAARAGAEVLRVRGGRAAQLNAGARNARGRQLVFLHADTLLPRGYAEMVRRTLENPATVAGAFRFKTDLSGAGMRLVEWGTRVRSSLLQWPYGDQGLFMEKRVFEAEGGFARLPIMEDVDMVRRLRRRGRLVVLDAPAVTSGRRWRKLGVLRTTLCNQLMIAGFVAGLAPERLAAFYRTNGKATS